MEITWGQCPRVPKENGGLTLGKKRIHYQQHYFQTYFQYIQVKATQLLSTPHRFNSIVPAVKMIRLPLLTPVYPFCPVIMGQLKDRLLVWEVYLNWYGSFYEVCLASKNSSFYGFVIRGKIVELLKV